MKYIKSNIGFIISMIVLGVIALNPQLKSFVLQGFLKTGLFNPDVEAVQKHSSNKNTSLPKAPAVSFSTASGETIDISNSQGKVIFLNFWATWCPPCVAEMPTIQALKNAPESAEVLFIMIDADNNLERSDAFMKKHSYNFTVYRATSAVPESLFKGNLPTTVIIDKKGQIVFHHEGIADYNSAKMKTLMKTLQNN